MIAKKTQSTNLSARQAVTSNNAVGLRSVGSKKVYRYSTYESGGRNRWKTFFLILILMVINIGVWSYFSYQVHVWKEECEFSERAAEQARRARLQEKVEAKKAIAMDTVALVDGEPITLTQVREMAEAIEPLKERPFEEIYPNLLRDMIDAQVLLQNAKKAGVLDRPEVQRALDSFVQQLYLNELLAEHVTEEELKQVYQEELKDFKREEEIHARHILVKTEKEAKDIIVQLNAGADFAELADEKSLDETAAAGGDLGYFKKTMVIPEFGDAVFDMKKGQLSAPIKTVSGWHVVLVEDKRLANPPEFDEVREELFFAVRETKLPEVLDEERAKLNVQVLKPTWESVE